MSAIKRFAEAVSVEMGYGGELTPEVLKEADRRLKKDNQSTRPEHMNNDTANDNEEAFDTERN
jgi:hypothetical protein